MLDRAAIRRLLGCPSTRQSRVPSPAALRAANDDIPDDTFAVFDDIRYCPVAVNPLIKKKTTVRQM
jgi:hypothetical protein